MRSGDQPPRDREGRRRRRYAGRRLRHEVLRRVRARRLARHCARERFAGGAHGLEALRRIASASAREPLVERGRQIGHDVGRSRLRRVDGQRDRPHGHTLERSHAGERFEREDAQRPDVRTRIDLLAEDLLRAHVVGRSEELTRRRRERRASLVLRGTEVEELHERLSSFHVAEEDVLRLEVAMDHLHAMRSRERLRELRDDDRDLGGRHSAVRGQVRAEVMALEQLHHDVCDAVLGDARVEHLYDVRALHRRGDRGLACEASGTVDIGGELLRHQLHDHVRLEHEMLGDPHRSHAALSERAHEPHGRGHEGAWAEFFHHRAHERTHAQSSARGWSIERTEQQASLPSKKRPRSRIAATRRSRRSSEHARDARDDERRRSQRGCRDGDGIEEERRAAESPERGADGPADRRTDGIGDGRRVDGELLGAARTKRGSAPDTVHIGLVDEQRRLGVGAQLTDHLQRVEVRVATRCRPNAAKNAKRHGATADCTRFMYA